MELDIEESFVKLIPFLEILNDLFSFTELIVKSFQKDIERSKLEQDQKIDSIIDLIDKHKITNTETKVEEFKEQILSLKKLYK